MIKAVLIDDELQNLKAMAIKLSIADDLEIVGSFSEPEKAFASLPLLKPDVVFLDIEMPGLNGFQLLERLESISFEIIFVTAYQDYILNALRPSALDYLLKPVSKDELSQTLARLRKKLGTDQNEYSRKEQLQLFSETIHKTPTRLALANAQGVQFVKLIDIVHVEAMSNYAVFHLGNRQKIIVSKTLKEFEVLLTSSSFVRVNRSSIINIEYVSELRKSDGGSILLQDGTVHIIGPDRKKVLLERLNSF